MRTLKILGVLVALLTSAVAFANNVATPAESAGPIVVRANCVEVLGLEPTMPPLMVELLDRTSKPLLTNLKKLAMPACRSVEGARRAASLEGEDIAWIAGLPFVLEDSLEGLTDQAQFRRGLLLAEFPRSVHVAAGMFAAYSEDEMVWVLGHELAHGVYGHSVTKKCIGLLGGALAFVAFGYALATKRKRARRAAAGVGCLAVLTTILGTAHLNPLYELRADGFGVRATAQSRMSFQDAKAVAAEILERHPSVDESFLSKSGIVPAGHPPSKTRIDNVQALR